MPYSRMWRHLSTVLASQETKAELLEPRSLRSAWATEQEPVSLFLIHNYVPVYIKFIVWVLLLLGTLPSVINPEAS